MPTWTFNEDVLISAYRENSRLLVFLWERDDFMSLGGVN